MSADDTTAVSPQEQACGCPRWTTARQCYCLRYAPDDSEPKDEACECACHDESDDEDSFGPDYREYEARVIEEVYGNRGYVNE